MSNASRFIRSLENDAHFYNFKIRQVEMELVSIPDGFAIGYQTLGDRGGMSSAFGVRGLFQKSRLKRIIDKSAEYFTSKGAKVSVVYSPK